MAVSNTMAAAKAGCQYVDCTIGGIGERAGNCDYLKFIKASRDCLGVFKELDMGFIEDMVERVNQVIGFVPSEG